MGYLRARKSEHAQTRPFGDGFDPDEVLTFRQWIELNKLSDRTGRRILKAPGGPTITYLSQRRIGITRGNNRIWQQSRERVAS